MMETVYQHDYPSERGHLAIHHVKRENQWIQSPVLMGRVAKTLLLDDHAFGKIIGEYLAELYLNDVRLGLEGTPCTLIVRVYLDEGINITTRVEDDLRRLRPYHRGKVIRIQQKKVIRWFL